MNKKFNRSFIGYKEAEVENQINAVSLEHENNLKAYESQLEELMKENQRLKDEMQEVEFKILRTKEFENKIKEMIYRKFIEDCKKVYLIEQKYEEMVTYKKRILKLLEKIV